MRASYVNPTVIKEKGSVKEYNDGRSYNPEAVHSITQKWVHRHMADRESEFTKPTSCTVFCGTWNVNAKKQEEGLHDWILPSNQQYADIYAIGFQEIVDLNAMNVAINSSNTIQRAQFWQEKIAECLLLTKAKYTLIQSKTLVGLLLCVYVKDSLLSHVMDVRSTQLGVGLMGMMGNKGGVSVRLCFYDSSICFVCAHLAAHRENIIGRNSDYRSIIDRSYFSADPSNLLKDVSSGGYEGDIIDAIDMPKRSGEQLLTEDLNIHQHEIIFWLGDLNYRIDDVLTVKEVFAAIAAKQLEELSAKDQLNIERSKGNVFHGFDEGPLTFDPTYKYQPGTDVYDTRPDKKIRAPAWCDRVLWKTHPGSLPVQQLDYRCAQLNPSDHKPVSALFSCGVRTIVEERKKVVFKQLIDVLKKHNSNELPKVEVKGLQIKLDRVCFEEPVVSNIDMVNQGQSIAHWRFVPKLNEDRICKRWISVDTESGLLLPGESIRLAVTVQVDTQSAHALNAGKDVLEDLIVIRIEQSVDFHVIVSAAYQRSCFGVSLMELVRTSDAIVNTVQLTERAKSVARGPISTAAAPEEQEGSEEMSIPKELWRMVDGLWSGSALKEKDLFNSKSDPQEVAAIRRSLDAGLDLPSCTPHSLCDALTRFIAALPQPLLPLELYPTIEIDAANLKAFSKRFLDDLPPLSYNVFVYILSFLREVLSESNYNRCTPLLLAHVCLDCMTPPEESPLLKEDRRLGKQQCMQSVLIFLLTTSSL